MDITQLKKYLDQASSYWAPTKASYGNDIKFSNGVGQWSGPTETTRRRAKRLVETYNVIPSFIRPITNTVREAPPSIDVRPVTNADKMQARALSGLIRSIENESGAGQIYCQALENLCRGGLGAWRVVMSKDHHGEDQIRLESIDDPTKLYYDPASKAVDFYDARYAIFENVMSKAEYIENYGSEGVEEDDVSVSVWEMWYKNDNGKITLYVFDDCKILDAQKLEIVHIPYVLITADRMVIDGKTTYNSAIRDIKPLQSEINFLKSEAMTQIANAPKATWTAAKGSLVNPQAWANAATDPTVALEYERTATPPQPIPPPQAPAGYMDLATSNVDLMRQITGIYPDASVQSALAGASGKAIKTQIAVGQISSKQWIEALQIGIRRCGDIILDYISVYYYDDSIRITLGADQSVGKISVGPNHVEGATNVDLKKGRYKVIVSTGASYTTAVDQAVDRIMEIGKSNPQVFQVLTDWLIQNTNIPGSEELADRFRALLPPEVQQVISQTNTGDPYDMVRNQTMQMHQMAMQMTQMDGIIKQLQQQLAQASDMRSIEEAKIQAGIVKSQIDNQAKLEANNDTIRAKMTLQDDAQEHDVRMAKLDSKLDILTNAVTSMMSKLAAIQGVQI